MPPEDKKEVPPAEDQPALEQPKINVPLEDPVETDKAEEPQGA